MSTGSVSLSHLAHNTSCSNFFKQIDDNLTSEAELDQSSTAGSLKEITKRHWKPYDNKTCCFNNSCRKQFSALLERHHHCRRCGEIFCNGCLQFSRRLNKLAKPDPDGDWYKVCKGCFEQGQLSDGHTRSHTAEFLGLRIEYQRRTAAKVSLESPLWRSKLDLDRECQRLLRGFELSVGHSEIKRTLHAVRSLVTTPEWMKSSVWIREDIAISCQTCHETFSIIKQKNFCRVCGISVCKSCSVEDLLIYIPDKKKGKAGDGQPKLAIIKIIGCPEVEPEISWLMRVCSSCRNLLEERQIEIYEERLNPPAIEEFLEQLHKLDVAFYNAENRIRNHLPKYREIVELLEDSTRRNSSGNNMKTLAKAQGDLADALAQYVTIVQQLKKLRPLTETQLLLSKTFTRAKCEFYLNQMSEFRTLKHKLCESVSTESLDFIQRIMDKNAIISTHLYLRQLVYETIHLCHKYKIEEFLPTFLTKIEQLVESDVQSCLHKEKDDIGKHMLLVKEMIKDSLKENKLITISQIHISKSGTKYAQEAMQLRVEAILNQVNNQLCLLSANRSFQTSKASLQKGLEELKKRKDSNDNNEDEKHDFVFVDKVT